MEKVLTTDAPQPAGHYSQAIVYAGLVYVSGQIPINPKTGEKNLGSIEDQTRQVLINLSKILKAAGSDLGHALKITIYICDIDLWARVNAVYSEMFGESRPARTVVPTRELHHGFLIEVDAIGAVIKNN